MIASVTPDLPPEVRLTVVFQRGGGRDEWGDPIPADEFTVRDVLYTPREALEDGGAQYAEDVSAVLSMPAGAPVRNSDRGVVPACSWLPEPVEFQVSGRPQFSVLGTVVPIREVG